jgi:topoisomerase-4 subunit B
MTDLFSQATTKLSKVETSYTAEDIEVLEGLEPVQRRPGMYIGGTDENALHHLASEVLDNAMDEVVAGHATLIEIELEEDGSLMISDNGRGIPIDPHPKFPDKSALEVILTTLHSGGKFSQKAYQTSGGLHGVGISVVNALADHLHVEVVREQVLWQQSYSRGKPLAPLSMVGPLRNRRGTRIRFHPDPGIFGTVHRFRAARLFSLAKSKAYLQRGVTIRWKCATALLNATDDTPVTAELHFPGGLEDYLHGATGSMATVTPQPFAGRTALPQGPGNVEWAIHWLRGAQGQQRYYCNTIFTPQGGTHEQGLRQALLKGFKAYGEKTNNKKAGQLTSDDVMESTFLILSVFVAEPQFLGQTKEKLVSTEVTRRVEQAIKDHFDHWLAGNRALAEELLQHVILCSDERLAKRQKQEVKRQNMTQRLRLPGKLADCTRDIPEGTEIFLVEGDSAGGSAKQARQRETQAVLPLRGKILNVANSTADKIFANQEIADLALALGCGTGSGCTIDKLRYGKVVIMTDADVDGAHIAALLMTFFFQQMPAIVKAGRLFLAKPPLYRIVQGTQTLYAQNDAEKEAVIAKLAKKGAIEIGRFKGLGEMTAAQLRETTMSPATRTLLRIELPENISDVTQHVEALMGRKPELRLQFIQQRTQSLSLVKDELDI